MLHEEDSAGAPNGVPPLEIRQTRDLTLAEGKAITKLATQYHLRGFRRDFWHWPLRVLLCLAFGAVIAGFFFLNEMLRCCGRDSTWWMIGVLLFYSAACIAYRRRYLRFIALGNRATSGAGTRHLLDDAGYTIARAAQTTSLSWRGIASVERGPALAMIATSPVHCWPVVKAAFADQDVDGFFAELERRWKQARKDGSADVPA